MPPLQAQAPRGPDPGRPQRSQQADLRVLGWARPETVSPPAAPVETCSCGACPGTQVKTPHNANLGVWLWWSSQRCGQRASALTKEGIHALEGEGERGQEQERVRTPAAAERAPSQGLKGSSASGGVAPEFQISTDRQLLCIIRGRLSEPAPGKRRMTCCRSWPPHC